MITEVFSITDAMQSMPGERLHFPESTLDTYKSNHLAKVHIYEANTVLSLVTMLRTRNMVFSITLVS